MQRFHFGWLAAQDQVFVPHRLFTVPCSQSHPASPMPLQSSGVEGGIHGACHRRPHWPGLLMSLSRYRDGGILLKAAAGCYGVEKDGRPAVFTFTFILFVFVFIFYFLSSFLVLFYLLVLFFSFRPSLASFPRDPPLFCLSLPFLDTSSISCLARTCTLYAVLYAEYDVLRSRLRSTPYDSHTKFGIDGICHSFEKGLGRTTGKGISAALRAFRGTEYYASVLQSTS